MALPPSSAEPKLLRSCAALPGYRRLHVSRSGLLRKGLAIKTNDAIEAICIGLHTLMRPSAESKLAAHTLAVRSLSTIKF